LDRNSAFNISPKFNSKTKTGENMKNVINFLQAEDQHPLQNLVDAAVKRGQEERVNLSKGCLFHFQFENIFAKVKNFVSYTCAI
jgi:hypothetical protein